MCCGKNLKSLKLGKLFRKGICCGFGFTDFHLSGKQDHFTPDDAKNPKSEFLLLMGSWENAFKNS
jgi:hypothetical protein